jgi:peptide deformylase
MKIIKYPNKILLTKAEPVIEVNEEINKLMDDMLDCMFSSNGQGLAANQIGIPLRVFVANTDDELIVIANPIIQTLSEETIIKYEGCLSIPGGSCRIKRAKSIKLTGLNRSNNEFSLILHDNSARVCQHELDHLNGITLMQRADFSEKANLIKTVKRFSRKAKK